MQSMEPWCSLVNTLPCQGRDREFESRRLRILVLNFKHISPLGLNPDGVFYAPLIACKFWQIFVLFGKTYVFMLTWVGGKSSYVFFLYFL